MMVSGSRHQWESLPRQIRPAGSACNVSLVRWTYGDRTLLHGALRGFAERDRNAFELAKRLFAIESTVVPRLLDIVDDGRLITRWASSSDERLLEQQFGEDSVLDDIENGVRLSPPVILRLLAPLGELLDRAATLGCVPLELSPDHLVLNQSSLMLVGYSRHGYGPGDGAAPDVEGGRSASAWDLLGGDTPPITASLDCWREAQGRALLRLAGWMASGMQPRQYDATDSAEGLQAFLRRAGYLALPRIEPGSLAQILNQWADTEEEQAALGRIKETRAVVCFDGALNRSVKGSREQYAAELKRLPREGHFVYANQQTVFVELTPSPSGDRISQRVEIDRYRHGGANRYFEKGETVSVDILEVEIDGGFSRIVGSLNANGLGVRIPDFPKSAGPLNPESIRLGLVQEVGERVVPLAAFPEGDMTLLLAAQLSSAGWLLVEADRLDAMLRGLLDVARGESGLRVVFAGAVSESLPLLAQASGAQVLRCDETHDAEIAGRPWQNLPYVHDISLKQYRRAVLGETGGHSLARRSFPVGWLIEYKGSSTRLKPQNVHSLLTIAEMFPDDPALTLLIVDELIERGESVQRTVPVVQRHAAYASALPKSRRMRRDLLRLLFLRAADLEKMIRGVKRDLLPATPFLAPIWTQVRGQLGTEQGVLRLSKIAPVLARHASTLSDGRVLTRVLADGNDDLLTLAAHLPQEILGDVIIRLREPRVSELVSRLARDADVDLLSRFGSSDWSLLVGEDLTLRQIGRYGPGVACIVNAGGQSALGFVESLARNLRASSPRVVVRHMLEQDAAHWRLLRKHRDLVKAWWQAHRDFKLLATLHRLRKLDVDRLAPEVIDLAVEHRLSAGDLMAAESISALLNASLSATVADYVRLPNREDVPGIDWEWLPNRLFARRFGAIPGLGTLVDQIAGGGVHRWLIFGEEAAEQADVGLFTLSALLRLAPPMVVRHIGRQEVYPVLDRLAEEPRAVETLAAMPPEQRCRFAGLLPSIPVGFAELDLSQLPDMPDDVALVRLALLSGRGIPSCLAAVKGFTTRGRELLLGLGPIIFELPPETLRLLLHVETTHSARLTLALQERRCPGVVGVAASFGSDCIPFLTGPDAARVVRVLERLPARPGIGRWLRDYGHPGLEALERHGSDLLSFVDQEAAGPREIALVCRALELCPESVDLAVDLFRLGVERRVPVRYWSLLADMMRAGSAVDELEVGLFEGTIMGRHVPDRAPLKKRYAESL